MAYMDQSRKNDRAPVIKAILKKYNLKGTLSVRNYSTLVLTIKSGKLDFINNFNSIVKTSKNPNYVVTDYIYVNVYWYNTQFTGNCLKAIDELFNAMKGEDYFNHDDTMSDYFHRSHYIDINIGKWNKPYILTP